MKVIYRYLLLLMVFTVGVVVLSCSDEESGGKPVITYVRITTPASSDSLVGAAGQGQMVAIMGRNLGNVRQLWFNDKPAVLNPSFITNATVITRIPSEIPEVITNELKMIFSNGDSLIYDFSVNIGKPQIDRLKSEYVNEGDVAIIYGNYFYEPLTVTFTGGLQGEIVSVEDDVMEVIVPQGAQPGPITIASNFGKTESNLWFKDNRNIILSFDNMSGINGQAPSSSSLWHPVPGDVNYASSSVDGIPSINGNYLYNPLGGGGYAAWGWAELWTGTKTAPELADLKNIPKESFTNPRAYSLKFEVLTTKSLTGAWINIWIGNDISKLSSRGPVGGKLNPALYTWQPNLDTEGVWQTVTIPWSEFYAYAANSEFVYSADGYDISVVMQGPNAATVEAFAIDNVRVVPNTNN